MNTARLLPGAGGGDRVVDQLGVVTIDDRPRGALRGGVFERRTWGWPFLVTHGQQLVRARRR